MGSSPTGGTKMNMNRWVIIDLSYAYFAIEIDNDSIVVKTAPIAKWMIGKSTEFIYKWVEKKKGKIVTILE